MSAQQFRPDPSHATIPETLESSQSKLVYLYISIVDGATIQELQETLGLKKLSLYPVLRRLIDEDVVERTENVYVCTNA